MGQMADTWRIENVLTCNTETFRVHQDIKWVGEGSPIDPTDDEELNVAFVSFLESIYFSDCTIEDQICRQIFYKQGAPPHPEHPPLWTRHFGVAGTGATLWGGAHNSNYLPADVAVYCKKTTSGGRSGKQFLRNILTEADVASALAGGWAFADHDGGWQTTVFNAAVVTVIGDWMFSGSGAGNYKFAVTHLEAILDSDARTPFSTLETGMIAVRPTWNKAHR
jgi:hypothetical protein